MLSVLDKRAKIECTCVIRDSMVGDAACSGQRRLKMELPGEKKIGRPKIKFMDIASVVLIYLIY